MKSLMMTIEEYNADLKQAALKAQEEFKLVLLTQLKATNKAFAELVETTKLASPTGKSVEEESAPVVLDFVIKFFADKQ